MTTTTTTVAAAMDTWHSIPISPAELDITTVLRCGQSFRWQQHPEPGSYTSTLSGRILTLRQDSTHLHYRSIPARDDTAALLHDYFNLDVSLAKLYAHWCAADPNFRRHAPAFAGVRMLRQDPWENLLSFICSSNNNIARISQMVTNLTVHFGARLGEVEGVELYDFPPPEALLAKNTEERLRKLGFGYRAKYIAATAKLVGEKGRAWLEGLRGVPYEEAKEELMRCSGVGPKVADCICLMSLDKMEVVPVDTHVWQIAKRDYGFKSRGVKNAGGKEVMGKGEYEKVGEFFRGLWGKEAGWAHSVLFAADLKVFEERVVKKEKVVKVETEVKKEDGVKVEETEETEVKKVKRVKVEETEETEIKKVKRVKVTRKKTTIKRELDEDDVVINAEDIKAEDQDPNVKTDEVKTEEDSGFTTLAERVKRRRRN